MRISDWSSDVCSSDLKHGDVLHLFAAEMRDKPGRHGKACKALRQPRPHLARNVFADRLDRFISAAREPFVMIGAPLRDQIDELPIYGHANGPAIQRLRQHPIARKSTRLKSSP